MYNKKAFTFVELIVSITILILVSGSGMFYFFDFIATQELKTEVSNITENIKKYDREVKKHKIIDYSIEFGTGYYISSLNNKNHSLSQKLDLTTGVVNIPSGDPTSIWNIKIYRGYKLIINEIKNGDDSYTGSFIDHQNYTITSYLDGKEINTLGVVYFGENNYKNIDPKTILTSGIHIVENVGGNKTITNNTLEFERDGSEEILILK